MRDSAVSVGNIYLFETDNISIDIVVNENSSVADTICDSALINNGSMLATHKEWISVENEDTKISDSHCDNTVRDSNTGSP